MDTPIILAEPLSHIENLITHLRQLPQNNTTVPTSSSPPILPSSIPPFPSLPLPSDGLPDSKHLLSHLSTTVLPYLNLASISPNYYSFVTGGSTPAALTGDILASIYDQNVAVHLPQQTIATNVEVVALNMLLDLFHLPRETWGIGRQSPPSSSSPDMPAVLGPGSGTFTTGATSSNVLGLALGREHIVSLASKHATGTATSVANSGLCAALSAAQLSHLQILTTLPHSSIGKAASILGIGRNSIISINDGLDISLSSLETHLAKPHTASIVIISAGEVNTGHFATTSSMQLHQIRSLCNKYHSWIHVDGAFGLFARLLTSSPNKHRYTHQVNGCASLEVADSITCDGHKLLNVPYDCGFFFTRHKSLCPVVFGNGNAAYLQPNTLASDDDDGIQSPLNINIENSRRFRALPVYATLLSYGRQGYLEMLERQIGLARRVVGWLYDNSAYEVLPSSGSRQEAVERTFIIALFRARNTALNDALVERINTSGRMAVTGTTWEGRKATRIAVSNWQVDVERDSKLIAEVLAGVLDGFTG